ncbi:LacI family DNA-binding transcriptional regulator [Sphingobacterium bovistauri]|uniref:LacI family DNA-binding transcriptional regulator n=1 Tax=Sphingobacterium bovistauri TaxID=2781959 RepID=A0ABS7ZBM2_9SPHI|nr:LacI family DNA-binding transcriptional regulator [Sphingobacterium bovistauri]MCA5006280.1 LacI family DNA-binding transcriptional regulator [Sphingobacterium bovistauri]
MSNQVTIRTISEKTKFSLTTVSRVLNGTSDKYRISKTTQDLVMAEASRLGYIPNMAAKTLRSNKSNTIGLIVPSLNNPFFSTLASTMAKILFSHSYVVMMSDCDNNEKEEKKIIQSLLSQNLLGIIVIPTSSKRNYDILNSVNKPTVFIDRYFSEMNFFAVASNHYKSSMKLMDYLVSMGHKKIACIQGDEMVISNQLRTEAYNDAISKYNFSYQYLGGNSFTAEKGYLEMKLLLNKKERPTAVLALSDTILIGVLKAVKEAGLVVPNDLSIVSIDNSTYLDYLETPITSIDQPVLQIAELAIDLLISQIKKSARLSHLDEDKLILLDSNLIIRSSVLDLNN